MKISITVTPVSRDTTSATSISIGSNTACRDDSTVTLITIHLCLPRDLSVLSGPRLQREALPRTLQPRPPHRPPLPTVADRAFRRPYLKARVFPPPSEESLPFLPVVGRRPVRHAETLRVEEVLAPRPSVATGRREVGWRRSVAEERLGMTRPFLEIPRFLSDSRERL